MNNQFLKFIPLLYCTLCLSYVTPAAAENRPVPIPPKRPDILNVSPAYLETLTKRSVPDNIAETVNHIEPASGLNQVTLPAATIPSEDLSLDQHIVQNINATELIKVLEDTTPAVKKDSAKKTHINILKNIPIPSIKPKKYLKKNAEDSETLISFTVKPDQLHLDDAIKDFLSHKAISLFRENYDLKLDIQAYAKMEDNKPNSDTRISLARALQVRQFLMQKGISPSRLKLSAMGQDTETKSHNRIDLVFKSVK